MVKQYIEEMKTLLVMGDDVKESCKRAKGVVVSVGSGEGVQSFGLSTGEMVYFIEGAGEPVKFNDDVFILLRPHELLAVEK